MFILSDQSTLKENNVRIQREMEAFSKAPKRRVGDWILLTSGDSNPFRSFSR